MKNYNKIRKKNCLVTKKIMKKRNETNFITLRIFFSQNGNYVQKKDDKIPFFKYYIL